MTEHARTVQILRNLRHGGQIVTGDPGRGELRPNTAATAPTRVLFEALKEDEVAEISTAFGYLFDELAAQFPAHHLQGDPDAVTAALKRLGEAMAEPAPAPDDRLQATGNSTIPTAYTYWGQFIDHDLTANTDRQNTVTDITAEHLTPLNPQDVVRDLRNLRQPALNLDSVYGDGPTFGGDEPTAAADFYDGLALRLSDVAFNNDDGSDLAGDPIVGTSDAEHDLPREAGGRAVIGDGRNDENLVVAQLHVAFLRFHNAVLRWVQDHPPHPQDERQLFERVSNLVRWHYQWLVVHDFLKTVTVPGVVDKILLGGNRVYAPRDGETYMPLEFSVASYRFGHTMVRGAYDYNSNFGRRNGGPGAVIPFASFNLLFAFTGSALPNPFNGGTKVLPTNWVIEWDRFVDKGDSVPDHFTRRIDTQLAPALFTMINQVTPEDQVRLSEQMQQILQRLAVRNLLRGYQLALPTGQAVAAALGVRALTEDQLKQGNSDPVNQALVDGGFLSSTPLWFYILKEAEVTANGNSLGEVGSRIVAETVIGQLRADPGSFLNQPGQWGPEQGARLPNGEPIVTIKDLLHFAGVLPG
jgi:Animal haem peroxidase